MSKPPGRLCHFNQMYNKTVLITDSLLFDWISVVKNIQGNINNDDYVLCANIPEDRAQWIKQSRNRIKMRESSTDG